MSPRPTLRVSVACFCGATIEAVSSREDDFLLHPVPSCAWFIEEKDPAEVLRKLREAGHRAAGGRR